MPNDSGTLEVIVTSFARVIEPLSTGLSSENIVRYFAQLGYPLTAAQADSLSSGTLGVSANLTELSTVIGELVAASDGEDNALIIEKGIQAAARLVQAIDAFVVIKNVVNGLGLSTATAAEIAELPQRLLAHLLVENLERLGPLNEILELLGVLQRVEHNIDSVDPAAPEYTVSSFQFGRTFSWLSDPGGQLETQFGWGGNSFDGSLLLPKLETLIASSGMPVIYHETEKRLDMILLEITAPAALNPRGLQVTLNSQFSTGTIEMPNGDFTVTAELGFNAPSGLAITVQPNGQVELIPPDPTIPISGEGRLGLITNSGPWVLLGEAGKSRLEIKGIGVDAGARLTWTPASNRAAGAVEFGGRLSEGKVVIDTSGGDGFLSQIIGGTKIEGNFALAMGYASDTGFYIEGSGGVEIRLPLHIDLGPIGFDALTIAAGFNADNVSVGLGADISANLGPLQAVVQNMGVNAKFSFPDDGGNLGPVDFDIGFKPPNGVGLSIDAGVVKGGGYLYFDFDKEEYAGILELEFSGFLTLKAIGLITTRMPDGTSGFSLLIIITAEFGSPLQLGFGFTLNAVGGLLGLNRTMRMELIATGVRTGAIESIMFPTDVIANAPRIISDLREFFPPQVNRFLIGPMAKLGWGTPTLVTLSLGVIIEIPPGNIAILGVLKVALPHEDTALILLQVNFIGAIEVDKKRIWFFAELFESRVIFMTLEGGMGLLVAFGDDANFVLAVGGFHPSFSPPALPFPSPNRVSVNILNTPVAKVRVMGYFAVTSNTAQFGARVEIYFGVSAFRIEGHLGFDALFQFSPFYFIITISASVDVKVFGVGLFSVHVRGQLEGTSPWHIEGEGSISILFFSIDVPFSATWGEDENTTLPPIEVMPLIEQELQKLDNWLAEAPGSNRLLVSLRKIEAIEDLVLHPVGTLRVSQRAVPLNLALDKIGSRKPSDVRTVVVDVPGADLSKKGDTQEQFAIAQFKDLSDSAKLSSPAYQRQNAGVELSVASDQVNSSAAAKRVVRYEEIIIDNNFKEHVFRFVIAAFNLFTHFLAGGRSTQSVLSATYGQQRSPIEQAVTIHPLNFVVAFDKDNTPVDATAHFTSHAEAEDYMRERIQADPSLARQLQVIPATEMQVAA